MMHALAFRVMRVCRPNLPPDGLLHANLNADFIPDDIAVSEPENVVGLYIPSMLPPLT